VIFWLASARLALLINWCSLLLGLGLFLDLLVLLAGVALWRLPGDAGGLRRAEVPRIVLAESSKSWEASLPV
jgi:hypothetical protein